LVGLDDSERPSDTFDDCVTRAMPLKPGRALGHISCINLSVSSTYLRLFQWWPEIATQAIEADGPSHETCSQERLTRLKLSTFFWLKGWRSGVLRSKAGNS